MPNYVVNSIVVVLFYRLQPITTALISKLHKKSLALTLFNKLCLCRGQSKLTKTSLTHDTERQTDAGSGTINTSYIMDKLWNELKATFGLLLGYISESNSDSEQF